MFVESNILHKLPAYITHVLKFLVKDVPYLCGNKSRIFSENDGKGYKIRLCHNVKT